MTLQGQGKDNLPKLFPQTVAFTMRFVSIRDTRTAGIFAVLLARHQGASVAHTPPRQILERLPASRDKS